MKVCLKTYGCQMNEYDTELVKAILAKEGYVFTDREDEADIVLLNTCSVRDNAHRKVFGKIHAIRHARQGSGVIIGILGCMATGLRQNLLNDRHLNIDLVVGPDSYKRLPNLIQECLLQQDTLITGHRLTNQRAFDVTLSEFETYSDVYPIRERGVNAWVAVMRGCNNFCSFCVVPYTRGRERSRSVDNILDEVRRIADEGFPQVTLLGQNVNSYHHEGKDFADLIRTIADIDGIKRVRFTSPHPKDFPDKLLEVITDHPHICKHIHLPLQAGNDHVLERMDRTYTRSEFLALVEKIRGKCPGIVLTTDIIIGFPSETDAQFEDTVRVVEKVAFDAAFIFKYSPRPHTIAVRKFPDDVPEEIKTARIVRLNAIQKEMSLKCNKALIGSFQEVLMEKPAPKDSGDGWLGRTDGNKITILPGESYKMGGFILARIVGASPNTLRGELVNSSP